MIQERSQLVQQSTHNLPRLGNKAGRRLWGGALVAAIMAALLGAVVWQPNVAQATQGTAAPDAQLGNSLMADQEAMANLYSNVIPSVVNIQVTSHVSTLPGLQSPDGSGSPIEQALGSGFIYDNDGDIVTNNHVVEGADDVLVIFSNGYWAKAKIVATDPQADLAVIKVTPPEGMDWKPLPLADPKSLRVGHSVIAIGNPFGLDGTMTTGIVSALGRGIPLGDGNTSNYTLPDVIQTDAAINPGNSGGPLLNLDGKVVGINFAIRSEERANAGVGFAIPVSIISRVIPALIKDGHFPYAYLGLSGSSINPFLAEALDLPDNHLGVYVATVIPGGPSDKAGILGGSETVTDSNGLTFERGGDIVTAVDNIPVARFEDLVSFLVTKASPGQKITLTILRGDKKMDIPVTLGERPSTSATASNAQAPSEEGVNAREAIDIATKAAKDKGMLKGDITERIATPDTLNGTDVWVVELVTKDEDISVTVDKGTGEVLDIKSNK